MGLPVATGGTNYSSSASGAPGAVIAAGTSKFIPQIWSSKLVQKFYKATVFGEIANTDYEGEIKQYGDEVIIRTIPDITVNDYVKGQALTYQAPNSTATNLLINKGKYFAFEAKKVDVIQSDLNLINMWSEDGAEQMKIAIDTDVLAAIPSQVAAANAGNTAGLISGNFNLGSDTTPLAITKTNVLDTLVDYGTVLDEQNIPESNRWVVIPKRMAGLLKKSDLKDASITGDNESTLRNGRLGRIDNFTIYTSNSVQRTGTGASAEYDVMFGHKSALTFASQITDMEKLPNPTDFGEYIRALNVFGFKVIKPEAIGTSRVTLA